jgi:hypothetical protein
MAVPTMPWPPRGGDIGVIGAQRLLENGHCAFVMTCTGVETQRNGNGIEIPCQDCDQTATSCRALIHQLMHRYHARNNSIGFFAFPVDEAKDFHCLADNVSRMGLRRISLFFL